MRLLWLVFLASDGSRQINFKRREMSATRDMTSHTWKVSDPFEYKNSPAAGWEILWLGQLSALEIHVQSKSHLGMENVTDSAGLLETHDVLHSKQGAGSCICCLFVPGAISMAPPCPQAWCDAKSKVSFSNRNRNQVTIILRRVPVITRDKEYVTYSDGPGFAISTVQMPNSQWDPVWGE